MAENDVWIQRVLIGAIVGIYGWFLKHISASRRHPCADNIVFQDVCDAEKKRLEDCIEGEVKRSEQRHTELRQDMKDGFAEIKELIKNKN